MGLGKDIRMGAPPVQPHSAEENSQQTWQTSLCTLVHYWSNGTSIYICHRVVRCEQPSLMHDRLLTGLVGITERCRLQQLR